MTRIRTGGALDVIVDVDADADPPAGYVALVWAGGDAPVTLRQATEISERADRQAGAPPDGLDPAPSEWRRALRAFEMWARSLTWAEVALRLDPWPNDRSVWTRWSLAPIRRRKR